MQVSVTWTRSPGTWPASNALTLPGAMLTWSTWDGVWIAWLPECEQIHERSLYAWCERVGVPMPTDADLAWLAMEGE